MTTLVYRQVTEPLRSGLTHAQIWDAEDKGLIQCWENGREHALLLTEIAEKCRAGQLPILNWKGGVAHKLKQREKFGSLKYLAQWQGLRGEDLNIDLAKEYTLTCAATGMVITFTLEQSKYLSKAAGSDKDGEKVDGRLASGISEQSLF
ncbi:MULTISPECIES: hypothetical protein [Pseudomonas syringae group]|uniref:hypothetical protein n=1 Tax=Pseudomonas syringae group TaxID=136849 RepID=UPI0006E6DC4B|nr:MULTISPECIES: hypothetical protein [Pseudomonas syringae group]KPW31154.1 hypothetical protein ALO66_200046 [Pseudomonas coronafaciens pv. atropurpurea]